MMTIGSLRRAPSPCPPAMSKPNVLGLAGLHLALCTADVAHGYGPGALVAAEGIKRKR